MIGSKYSIHMNRGRLTTKRDVMSKREWVRIDHGGHGCKYRHGMIGDLSRLG